MKLSLVVLATGQMHGKVLPILTPQFVIGRDPGCHLRPSSPMISKKHCALIIKDERVFIKDFGSTNGSFVNEIKVEGHRELKHGDKLKIGPLFFEVTLETASAVAAGQTGSKPPSGIKPKTASITKTPVTSSNSKTSAPKPAASVSSGDSDDDLAALLLSGGDDTVADGPSANIDQGTTVFELPAQRGAGDSSTDGKPVEPAKPAGPPPTNSEKAAAILDMMRKRPRTPNP